MRTLPTRRGERSICATAGWSTDDRTAGAPQHHLPPVAVDSAVLRLRSWSRGDDRAAVDRRGDVVAGAEREAGRWRNYHRSARGTGYRGHEDRRHRRPVLLDRPRVIPLPPGAGVAEVQGTDRRRCAADRGATVVRADGRRQGVRGPCER